MAIDGSVIDEDHMVLIELINAFEELINRKITIDETISIFTALKKYAAEHFRREEKLMRLIHYPFYDAHVHEHQDIINKLDQLYYSVKAAKLNSDIIPIIRNIVDSLHDWFINHTIQCDLRMRTYVEEMKGK